MKAIKDITPKELAAGITGHYAHGEKCTLGYVELKRGSSVPLHSHPHEQITYILEGRLQMVIDGKDCLLEQGMCHVIHSNVMHGAEALTDCQLIDVFSPARTDYKTE